MASQAKLRNNSLPIKTLHTYPTVFLKFLSSAACLARRGSSLSCLRSLPLDLFLGEEKSPPTLDWSETTKRGDSTLYPSSFVNNVGINHWVAVAYWRQIPFKLSTFCNPRNGPWWEEDWRILLAEQKRDHKALEFCFRNLRLCKCRVISLSRK